MHIASLLVVIFAVLATLAIAKPVPHPMAMALPSPRKARAAAAPKTAAKTAVITFDQALADPRFYAFAQKTFANENLDFIKIVQSGQARGVDGANAAKNLCSKFVTTGKLANFNLSFAKSQAITTSCNQRKFAMAPWVAAIADIRNNLRDTYGNWQRAELEEHTVDAMRDDGQGVELQNVSNARRTEAHTIEDPFNPESGAGPVGECRVCGKDARFMCSRCSQAHYCSQECQAADWPEHRQLCQKSLAAGAKGAGGPAPSPAPGSAGSLEEGGGGGVVGSHEGLRHRRDTDGESIAESISRARLTGRSQAAQALNRGSNWKRFFKFGRRDGETPQSPPEEEPPMTEEEKAEELRFYVKNIYLIIKPVICCILLSVLWIKLTRLDDPFFDPGIEKQNDVFGGGIGAAVGGGSPPGDTQASVFSALMILGMIVVVTVIILLLFKYNQMKILYGIFGVIVLSLLGLFGYTLGLTLLFVYNGAMDYITFFFFLWNLCAVGLVVIFWKGPLLLQQIYLVIMSSKMAFALSELPAVTTWVLLALLAVWAAVWVGMAAPPDRTDTTHRRRSRELQSESHSIHHVTSTANLIDRDAARTPAAESDRTAAAPPPPTSAAAGEVPPTSEPSQANAAAADEPEEEEESSGLKLGLGDFVFYSVLVARAAVFDWVTTVAVMVAVMTGLNMTIFLLAIWHKALPALPISIAFGLLFYFVSSITLTPYENNLMNVPDRLRVVRTDPSGLWVGKTGGAGLVYI
ncbi:Presenilin-2 [Phlyctochytrium bullatum]|nr:Presenilin-2 [Phlyctochytrium bullatum]